MLGVFDRFFAKQPEQLLLHFLKRPAWIRTCYDVKQFFISLKSDSDLTFYNFMNGNFMALAHKDETPPRTVVAAEDIFCIFSGTLDNYYDQRLYYGLPSGSTEAMIVVAAYKLLRDRRSISPDHIVRALKGRYAFILFDTKLSTVFIARDRDGNVNLHWGTSADGSLVCCDDSRIVIAAGGNCYTPFPPGCFFLSGYGLINYDHPFQKLKTIEQKNDNGRTIALEFHVDWFSPNPFLPRNSRVHDLALIGSLNHNTCSLGLANPFTTCAPPLQHIHFNRGFGSNGNVNNYVHAQPQQMNVSWGFGSGSNVNNSNGHAHQQQIHSNWGFGSNGDVNNNNGPAQQQLQEVNVNWGYGSDGNVNISNGYDQQQQYIPVTWEVGLTSRNGELKELQLADWSLPYTGNVINVDDDQEEE